MDVFADAPVYTISPEGSNTGPIPALAAARKFGQIVKPTVNDTSVN